MKTMLAVDEALALIRSCCAPLAIEQVPLADAFGRVLAAPVDAPRNLPPFANSAMDGFALRWREGLVEDTVLPVLAEQAAGDGIAGQSEGACSIMTGARIPDGLDTVVPVEDCTVLARDGEGRPTSIALSHAPQPGHHVRHAGEDVAAGQCVLEAGARLGEEALLVLRGIGIGTVAAHRRPRLALACTGRELVDTDGAELAPGQIANTNGPYLERLFAEAGAEVVERVTLPDVGLFSDGTAVKLVGEETFRVAQALVDEYMTVDTDAVCAAIKDIFVDTRSIVEPAGALAVAAIKQYVAKNKTKGETYAAILCGANMNFDRLRFVAERAEVGEEREALLAVTIP